MKKLLCVLLCAMLLPVAALAEDSAAPMLSAGELTDWAQAYIDRAKASEPLNDPANSLTPDGYEYIYNFATLYGDTPQMSADTVISAVVILSEEENGPRNVNVGNAMSVVVDAYYNENPNLLGSKSSATLYAVDMLPESAFWGQVLRDGQRVQTIQYGVHEQYAVGGEGYTDMGVIYTMSENTVNAVRVYGLNARIGLDTVNTVMYNVMAAALDQYYAQVPFSYDGSQLAPFGAEDLTFSGVDMLNVQPDDAIAVLGEPLSDTWADNGDEGYLRVQTYPSCELIYLFDDARKTGHLYMLVITSGEMEGPRGVRIGDSFASVYNRFRHGEGEYQEDGTELLYGAEAEGTYGKAAYGEDASATILYSVKLQEGHTAMLQMNFTVMDLTEILLYVE